MASRISVECPGCLAKVALPDSSKLGKKVKCPKCSDIFVAEAAEDEESDETDDDVPAQSKSRKRPAAAAASARGGKRRKPSGGGSGGGGATGPLIAVGAVAVVVLIGVGLWLSGVFSSNPPAAPPIAQPAPVAAAPMVAHAPPALPTPSAPPAPPAVSPTERTLALRWLPQDTEVILHVKVADLWQAPLLKGLVESPTAAPGIKDFQAATGLLPTDVESVTMGLGDTQQLQNAAASSMLGMPPQPPKAVAIVRTKKPVSMDDILKAAPELKTAEYNSKKYVEATNNEYCSWLAEPSTLIIAKSDDLKSIMDRGEASVPRKELLFADATPHVILLFAPKDPKSLPKGAVSPSMSPEMGAMQKAMEESFAAFSLGVNIRGGFDVQTSVLLKDAQGAATVKTGIDSGLAELRKTFDSAKMTAPPLFVELGEQLLNNLKVETKDQIVKVTTNLPDSDQQKIEQVPPLVMMMAMTGGLGGGGASPFGGPPKSLSPSSGGMPPDFRMPSMADGKNPGQTDPVEAQLAEGLPNGMTLSAMASWSQFPAPGPDMKAVYPMQLILDVKGDDLQGICGYGQVTFKVLAAAEGGNLKVAKTQSLVHGNVVKMLLPYEPGEGVSFDHPDGVVRMIVLIDQPPAGAKTLAAMEGSFKILTAEESEEFTITEAPKTAKRPLTDPNLKAAGVKLVKSNDVLGEALTLSCGKGFFLGRVKGNNPESQDLLSNLTSHSEVEKNQPVQKLIALGNAKLAPQLTLEGKLYKGVKEKSVAFKFANVTLPSAETRPVPTQGNLPQQSNVPGPIGQPGRGQP